MDSSRGQRPGVRPAATGEAVDEHVRSARTLRRRTPASTRGLHGFPRQLSVGVPCAGRPTGAVAGWGGRLHWCGLVERPRQQEAIPCREPEGDRRTGCAGPVYLACPRLAEHPCQVLAAGSNDRTGLSGLCGGCARRSRTGRFAVGVLFFSRSGRTGFSRSAPGDFSDGADHGVWR